MTKHIYIIQDKNRPEIYYEAVTKRDMFASDKRVTTQFKECGLERATKFSSLKAVKNTIDGYFNNTLKGQFLKDKIYFRIVKCQLKLETVDPIDVTDSGIENLNSEVNHLTDALNNTHYTVAELWSKIRKKNLQKEYVYIIATTYDRMNTSKIQTMFESQNLEHIKYKGNFAFKDENFWVAAQLLCDCSFKAFKFGGEKNLTHASEDAILEV